MQLKNNLFFSFSFILHEKSVIKQKIITFLLHDYFSVSSLLEDSRYRFLLPSEVIKLSVQAGFVFWLEF